MSSEHKAQSLEAAKRHASKRMLYVVLGCSLGALALLSFVLFSNGLGSTNPNSATSDSDNAAAATEPAPLPPSDSAPCIEGAPCPSRDEFLTALKTLQQDLEPALDAVSAQRWAEPAYVQIQTLETSSLAAFEAADYGSALQQVTQASAAAHALLDRAEGEFEDALEAAVAAFERGEAADAASAIERALLIHGQDPVAQALQARIAVLPEVLPYLEAARVARVENRPEKEAAALAQVLALDSERDAAAERLQTLQEQARERSVTAAIGAAEAAIAAGDLESARKQITLAQRKDPTRDLKYLTSQLAAQQKAQTVARALAQARQARGNEDWSAAAKAYAAVLAIEPSHAESVRGAQQAKAVGTALQQVTRLVEQPIRLGDKAIAEKAAQLLTDYQGLTQHSPALATKLAQLGDLREQAQVPLAIEVTSDGKTTVKVRQVGHVGKHKRKQIQLLPGEYQFEGTRSGYKSKLVSLTVPLGAANLTVHVACDEPI